MTGFGETIGKAYAFEGTALELGKGIHEDAVVAEAGVRVPLRMLNRHGLIAGATGTGKTVTLQVIAEQLAAAGVPVVVSDVKGDLSGVAAPGAGGGPAEKRMKELGEAFEPPGFPAEYLSLGGIGPGVPVRATVTDFGPELLAKVLESNETQEQTLSLVFRYADEKGLPLLDLADLRALLTFLDSEAGQADLQGIGGVSSQTIGVLLRALAGLEDGGGNEFFGEPQLAIEDLMRLAPDGRGVISCVELPSVQDRPQLFSTALMWMVAELFEQLPEAGDLDKPKLVFFFEEAHLLFADATEAFLESVVRTVRMIRSKGVGIFFVTQSPKDVPGDVLGQLGNRVQHALRAFTPDDAKALKATVGTFPTSEFYDLEETLPQLGIGEAMVTILDEDGVPDARRAHPPARAAFAHGPGRRRGRGRQGVAAVRQVRGARGRPERPRDAGRAARGGRAAPARRRGPRPPSPTPARPSPRPSAARSRPRRWAAAPTPSATSSPAARARRSSARSSAACSSCCARRCSRGAAQAPRAYSDTRMHELAGRPALVDVPQRLGAVLERVDAAHDRLHEALVGHPLEVGARSRRSRPGG